MKKITRQNKGVSIVEIIVAATIIVIAVTGITGAWQLYNRVINATSQQTQAALLTEEIGEVINLLRDQSWNANIAPLSPDTAYYFYWDGNAFIATTTATTTTDAFVRTVVFRPVLRDAVSKDISTSGTLDPNTRQAVITVYPALNSSDALMRADMLIHNVYNN